MKTTIDPRPLAPRVLAALILCATFTFIAESILRGAWAAGQAPLPFVWRDVAIVHFACAIPLAWLVSQWLCRRGGGASTLAVLFAAALVGVGMVPSLDGVREELPVHLISGVALRATTALAFVIAATITGCALFGNREEEPASRNSRPSLAIALIGLVALLIAPTLYVHARSRHDRSRLADFLDQGRVGEARALTHALLAFDPQADWHGQPLTKVASLLDQRVRDLEALVVVPLPSDASDSARLRRAQQWAVLGQTDEALAVLPSAGDPAFIAEADNLRGAIYEARGDWQLSRASYQAAKDACLLRPPSPERTNQLLRATTGIAYAQRKAGDYVGADATYRELLALAPNSDTHFLLAQFYDDAQNAKKASYHAHQAMLLNSARYRKDGEQLIRKLTVFQFGCLRAARADGVR